MKENKRGSTEPMSEETYNSSGTIFSGSYDNGSTGGSNWNYFQDNTDSLLGEILTIIDASFTEQGQRDAVKSLVKNSFYKYRAPQNWTISTGSVGDNPPTVTFS